MMKKLLIVLLGLGLFAVYVSNASFAYFSDTETVEVSIQAGEWGQGVSVLYPCPHFVLVCHYEDGDGGDGFTGLNLTPFGAERLDPSKVQNVFAREDSSSIDVPSDGSVQCHDMECVGYLENIWLYPESNVTLERVRISWTGGGELKAFWVGGYKVRRINQGSPAEFQVDRELKGGCLYPVAFKFHGISLQDEYEFTITFFFSNDYSRTIHFKLGDDD